MEVLRNGCAETAKIGQECTTLSALIRRTADDFERQELNAAAAAAAAVRGAAGVSPIAAAAVKGVAAAAAWKGK
jgi:hypothetical protein